MAEADAALGLTAALAAAVPDPRQRRGRHTLLDLLRQRIYQIVAGYEDQDDADTLRRDPLLKLVCGRLPESRPRPGQPADLLPLGERLLGAGLLPPGRGAGRGLFAEREREGVPTHIVLDLDSTDDPTHGEQEGSAYHGYFRQHMYHPLLVFDGETGQFITAILRPGTAHAGHGAVAILQAAGAAVAGTLAGSGHRGAR